MELQYDNDGLLERIQEVQRCTGQLFFESGALHRRQQEVSSQINALEQEYARLVQQSEERGINDRLP